MSHWLRTLFKRTYLLSIVAFAGCSNPPAETKLKSIVPKDHQYAVRGTLSSVVPVHRRDTISIQTMIEGFMEQHKSTNYIDTLVNGTYESIHMRPQFTLRTLDTISESDFLQLQKTYNKTPKHGLGFPVRTAAYVVEFPPGDLRLGEEHYFGGISRINGLSAYTFTESIGSGGKGITRFWLLDSISNKLTKLNSRYESGFEQILLSKDSGKFICTETNPYGETGSSIRIMDVHWDSTSYQLHHFLHFESTEWSIGKCYMIDHEHIAMRVYNRFECYYKAEKDSSYTVSYDPENTSCDPTYLVMQIVSVAEMRKPIDSTSNASQI